MGVCNCSMFCCTLFYVHSSIAIILMGKRELIALLDLSSWCLVMVERLFLAVPQGCLQFVIVVFPDHTHLLFFLSHPYHYHCQNAYIVDIRYSKYFGKTDPLEIETTHNIIGVNSRFGFIESAHKNKWKVQQISLP